MSPVQMSRDEEEAGLVRANAAIEKISGGPGIVSRCAAIAAGSLNRRFK